MASSFIEYAGYGFWAYDSEIELWLCLVAREIDKDVARDSWKRLIREHFVIQATAGFSGCITAISDEIQPLLSEPSRRQWLIDVSERAYSGLCSHAPLADGRWLNAVMEIDGRAGITTVWFNEQIDISPIISCGEKWLLLLKGNPPLGPVGQWGAIERDFDRPTRH